jgi:hypothetical protein
LIHFYKRHQFSSDIPMQWPYGLSDIAISYSPPV